MRPLLEPPPRPISNLALVGLVAAVVTGTAVMVLRYLDGARTLHAQPAAIESVAPPQEPAPASPRRGGRGPSPTTFTLGESAAPDPIRSPSPPGSASPAASPSLWRPAQSDG